MLSEKEVAKDYTCMDQNQSYSKNKHTTKYSYQHVSNLKYMHLLFCFVHEILYLDFEKSNFLLYRHISSFLNLTEDLLVVRNEISSSYYYYFPHFCPADFSEMTRSISLKFTG